MMARRLLFLFTLILLGACQTAPGPGSGQGATVPFELTDNRIFVDVSINGKGPYHFIFDTGGGNCKGMCWSGGY